MGHVKLLDREEDIARKEHSEDTSQQRISAVGERAISRDVFLKGKQRDAQEHIDRDRLPHAEASAEASEKKGRESHEHQQRQILWHGGLIVI
jgi:hypothetical protein